MGYFIYTSYIHPFISIAFRYVYKLLGKYLGDKNDNFRNYIIGY